MITTYECGLNHSMTDYIIIMLILTIFFRDYSTRINLVEISNQLHQWHIQQTEQKWLNNTVHHAHNTTYKILSIYR